MCGRFTLRRSGREVAEHFGLAEAPSLSPRYNAAPGQAIAVVREARAGEREVELQRWGLVPGGRGGSGGRPGPRPLVNARSETAARRPAFAGALRCRRALVPADGFYEWGPRPGGGRGAWHVRLPGEALFGIAALWEPGAALAGDGLSTCALLTTAACRDLAGVHERMPVILRPEDHARWLDPRVEAPEALGDLLLPHPELRLDLVPVGPRVNRVEHDDPGCLEPPPPDAQASLPL